MFAMIVIVGGCLNTETPLFAENSLFSPRNEEAPFCYLAGDLRAWPVFYANLGEQQELHLVARRNGDVLSEGAVLEFDGLHVDVSKQGLLQIRAVEDASASFQLEMTVKQDDQLHETQAITIRPAPPARPLSYVSDLVDDLIRIYWDQPTRQFKPITREAFDQYFRRLQAQGVSRLIVWQSPCPLIVDPESFPKGDWERYSRQAQAIIDCEELTEGIQASPSLKSYQWLRMLMAARLTPEFGQLYSESAAAHGISLSASFRPFEPALTKYYEVPVFETDGTYLGEYLPTASPTVNFHHQEVGFAHYREVLRQMGQKNQAELDSIEVEGVLAPGLIDQQRLEELKGIELLASPYPPLDETSFVLVRDGEGNYELHRYAQIQERAESQIPRLGDAKLNVIDGRLTIDGIQLPESARYLIVRAPDQSEVSMDLPAVLQVVLTAKAGNRLGRVNSYVSLRGKDAESRSTRVAGIPEDGSYRTGFQAIENGIDLFRKSEKSRWNLSEGDLVIDVGAAWSVEMLDLERSAARDMVVRQLRPILAMEAFDEIFINTRSHTQLAASSADGPDGIQPMAHYRLKGTNYFHNGIDRAFAPISIAKEMEIQSLPTEQITTWQKGEWIDSCQTEDSPFVWRYQRNLAVARGIRALLQDLEQEFSGVRIRAVIPHNESVITNVRQGLESMNKSEGGVYGSDYIRHLWGSLNYIPVIGEGMAMVDLSGLSVEPTFLGIRYLPDEEPLALFVDQCTAEFHNNLGSSFRGPRSFFYEAQETLRNKDPQAKKRREEILCGLLAREEEIGEVILYESVDWLYNQPLFIEDKPVYDFLDCCSE
ncbi:hypothetical protein [Polystyrenella longa]|uniref:hypothetical protein n=1 Tax=Polystyrenella longa TaxID=2528007 RepID=UPI0011A2F254|nr:hypothetical protein [Polystyrenella longa]